MLLGAAYRLYCKLRRGAALTDPAECRRALEQAIREAAGGHQGAMRVLDRLWIPAAP